MTRLVTVDREAPLVLRTDRPRLILRTIGIDDLDAYHALVDRNREHLNQRGDYPFEATASREAIAAWLSTDTTDIRFGIWLDGVLVGRVYLGQVDPAAWAIGYWLGAGSTGQGIATVACRAAIEHARSLGAAEIQAQITIGNHPSVAVVRRLGFEHVEDVGDQSRWRLVRADGSRDVGRDGG